MSDSQPSLFDFLDGGYFPKELPPAFTTSEFARSVQADDISESRFLITNESDPNALRQPRHPESQTRPSTHHLSRRGGGRRRVDIVHPVSFYYLAREIARHWDDLSERFAVSNLSVSEPISDDESDRAVTPKRPGVYRPKLRAEKFCKARCFLKADVASFYGSIYTHTIPWVLHGKQNAKENIGNDHLLGNRIDTLLQNCQSRQTRGMPVGPDTSFVIGELLLSKVDERLGGISDQGFRFYDDFEVGCDDSAHAKEVQTEIENAVHWLEMELNLRKTSTEELPANIDHAWLRELRRWEARRGSVSNADTRELMDFWDLAIHLQKKNPYDPVLKNAIVKLSMEGETPDFDLRIYQSFLIGALLRQPGLARPAIHELLKIKRDDSDLLKDDAISSALNKRIQVYTNSNESNELAWSLWAALMLNLNLSEDSIDSLKRTSDSVVILLALTGRDLGILRDFEPPPRWADFCDEEALTDGRWLASYQIAKNDLLEEADGSIFESQAFSQELYEADVDFIRRSSFSDIGQAVNDTETDESLYDVGAGQQLANSQSAAPTSEQTYDDIPI